MKNIVIRSGNLLMGGIGRVLIEFLQNIDLKKYRVFLFIEKDYGKNNIFISEVPKDINIFFLESKELIEKAEYLRSKKKNIFYKILYNSQMHIERRIEIKNCQKYIESIKDKYGKIDSYIDFDCGTNKYIEKLDVEKKIAWLHISYPKLLKKKYKIIRFGKKLNKYDKVVNICNEMKEEIEKIYPFLKQKLEVCYNPFNFERIYNLIKDYKEIEEKKYLDLLKDEYILAVSRLALEQKDYSTLIKGYKDYIENGGKEKLYIIGDGLDKNKIVDLIKKEKLEKKIILLGAMKNPYIWMKHSKFFVHSSFYEGFGLVLVEAMICGKMVISSNCPTGPVEILSKDNCGEIFNIGNYRELSQKMKKVSEKVKNDDYKKILENRIKEFKIEEILKEFYKIIF